MSVESFLFPVHLNGDQNLRSKMLTTPKLKELQRPILITITCYQHKKFHAIPLNCYGEMPYTACVTTFTMHVHLHGAFFVSFLFITGRCCDAETSVILLLLDRGFS